MTVRADIADDAFVSGDTKTITFIVTDDGLSTGTAVNITSATIEWKLTSGPLSTTALLTKTVGSGITITDGPNGTGTIDFVVADTASLSGDYYHELQIIDSGSNKTTVLSGRFPIKRDTVIS